MLRLIVILLALLVGSYFGISMYREHLLSQIEKPHVIDPYKLYTLVNEYRASKNLQPLKWNPEMCEFAKQRLEEVHTDWSHNQFNKLASTSARPYPFVYGGENLGRGFQDEREQLEAWKNSTSHHEAMLYSLYTDTCIAADSQNTVQEFASF